MYVPMNIAYNGDRSSNVDNIAFTHKEFFCLFADFFEHTFGEELLIIKTIEARVEIEGDHSSDGLTAR